MESRPVIVLVFGDFNEARKCTDSRVGKRALKRVPPPLCEDFKMVFHLVCYDPLLFMSLHNQTKM